MIDEEILDKVCPIPDEDETMEEIKGKLGEEGFIINNFNKGGIFYIINHQQPIYQTCRG